MRSVLESLVQVGELVATATVLHYSSSLSLVSLFIDDEAIVGNDSTNLVFFFLTSNAEHLVVDLDADEVSWKDVCVAKANLRCRLRRQIVDHQLVGRIVVIVQTRFVLRKDEVRLEADHIVQKTAELVNFTADDNVGSRVLT